VELIAKLLILAMKTMILRSHSAMERAAQVSTGAINVHLPSQLRIISANASGDYCAEISYLGDFFSRRHFIYRPNGPCSMYNNAYLLPIAFGLCPHSIIYDFVSC
jgi:hypothetical protein